MMKVFVRLYRNISENYYIKYSVIVTLIMTTHTVLDHDAVSINLGQFLQHTLHIFFVSMILSFVVYQSFLFLARFELKTYVRFLLCLFSTGLFIWSILTLYKLIEYSGLNLEDVSFGEFLNNTGAWYDLMHELINDMSFAILGLVYFMMLDRSKHSIRDINENELQIKQLNEATKVSELNALSNKINPHFLFNSLNSITGLVVENKQQAVRMIDALKKFFYSINSSSGEAMTSVRNEIENVTTYLEIEKIRFQERLNFTLDLDPETLDIKIPKLILQPLVENAIKHGIAPYSKPGFIDVLVQKEGDIIHIKVVDSGKWKSNSGTEGYGLKNIKRRLDFIYFNKASISFVKEENTQVIIELPIV